MMSHYNAHYEDLTLDTTYKNLVTANLLSEADTISQLTSSGKSYSVYYYWSDIDGNRRTIIDSLKVLRKEYPNKRLQIADVSFVGDTAVWKQTIKNDSTKWTSYWAVGGALNKSLSNYKIYITPTLIVTDSLSRIIYRGPSTDSVARAVRERIDKKPK